MSRSRYLLLCLCLTAGCARPPAEAGGTSVVPAPVCSPSSVPTIRMVQMSPTFRRTAWIVASTYHADSATAVAYYDWLCQDLELHVPAELPRLRLVTMQSADDPARIRVAFAVATDTVVLLNNSNGGFPVPGLDLESWNGFMRAHPLLRIDAPSRARTVARVLLAIQLGAADTTVWNQFPEPRVSRRGAAWVVRVERVSGGSQAAVYTIARDGSVLATQ